jgi:hypothetical protein
MCGCADDEKYEDDLIAVSSRSAVVNPLQTKQPDKSFNPAVLSIY